jgi:hypothetical protein
VVDAAPGPDIVNLQDVSATTGNGELQVCSTNGPQLFHTVRFSNGNWSQFFDIEGAVGEDKGSFVDVDCTSVAGHMHLVALDSSGRLWHTVRLGDTGAWLPFGDVKNAAGNPGTISKISAAQWGGRLFVTAIVGGRIKVTMRRGDDDWHLLGAGWEAFEDVNSVLGNFDFRFLGMD